MGSIPTPAENSYLFFKTLIGHPCADLLVGAILPPNPPLEPRFPHLPVCAHPLGSLLRSLLSGV